MVGLWLLCVAFQISCNNINTISDGGASQHGPAISSLDCSFASLATLLAIQWHLWTTENLNMISCFCLLYFLLCELSVTAFAHLSFEYVVFFLEIWTRYSDLNILSLWCKYFSGCSVFVLLFITCICAGEREAALTPDGWPGALSGALVWLQLACTHIGPRC